MHLVAWAPTGISAPIELLAVLVEPGPITEFKWWNALADRVVELAKQADPDAITKAYRYHGIYFGPDADMAGEVLVKENGTLQACIALSTYDSEETWPAIAVEDENARCALEESDFFSWLDLAIAETSSADGL